MKELDTSHIKDWPKDVIFGEADILDDLPLEILSEVEIEEYKTFKNPKRKAEYVSARNLFKFLLSKLNINKNDVQILKEQEGKPYAKYKGKHIYLSFSHSPQKVYCAISEQLDIGLDVESIDREINPQILERITSEEEQGVLLSLKPVHVWTIKEAVVKFLGTGLRTNLNELTIRENENSRISVRFNNDKLIEICSFSLTDHQIALAYQSTNI